MSSGSDGREEERTDTKSVQTDCAGTEPYYNVPILQKVLSPAPGFSSALYSVQVMTQSEVDTMKSQRSGYQEQLQLQVGYSEKSSSAFYLQNSGPLSLEGFTLLREILIKFEFQRNSSSSCDKERSPVSPCDSTVQLPTSLDAANISDNHSNPTDCKPVNLSFPKQL